MILSPYKKKTWVKICGLTEPENALGCADLGADALGLVFFKKSPRNVSIQRAAQISTALPDHILTIGVFVNESYDRIMEKVSLCALKGVQLHGSEPPDLVDRLLKQDLVVIKALFATKHPLLTSASHYKAPSFFLVEYGNPNCPGGNAESWNYELSLKLETKTPVILAGGLDPDNISQALKIARPDAVDVSSGVETAYGIKDLTKVKSFITQIKSFSGL